jgi:nicotinamidase-related amidase
MSATMMTRECLMLVVTDADVVPSSQHDRIVNWIKSLAIDFDIPVQVTSFEKHELGAAQTCVTLLAEENKKAERQRLLIAGSYLESAITFVTLEALVQGFDVYLLADLISIVNRTYERLSWDRLIQAGAVPTTLSQIIAEWTVSSRDGEQVQKLQKLALTFKMLTP